MNSNPLSRFPAIAAALCLAAAFVSAEEQPKNPFAPKQQKRDDAKAGTMTLSDGKSLKGPIYMTRGKNVEIFEDAKNLWHEVKVADMAKLENRVEEEKVEREWRWKEGGNDEKVYTGREYVDRKYVTTVTRTDGTVIVGHLKGTVIYVATEEGQHKHFLRQDHHGDWGQKPAELIYIKTIVFEEPRKADEPKEKPPGDAPPKPDKPQEKEPAK